MKANKILAGTLVVLGFGGAVGLVSGCARRAQKSKSPESVADTVSVRLDTLEYMPIRLMYGVQTTPFREVRMQSAEPAENTAKPAIEQTQ